MLLIQITKGQSFRVYKVDKMNKMNIVGFLEDTFPGVKEIKEETRMKYVGSPIKIMSGKGKQTKRGPSYPPPNSQNKRVILGRKNQLIRMMKKSGSGDLLKSRYLRIN